MRKVLIWDEFFNNKENFKSSPYFMLNNHLQQKKLVVAKTNLKEFVSTYIGRNPLCGTNKESFKGVNNEFSFWHYHCEPYNKITSQYYNNKNCFDNKNYQFNFNLLCQDCISLNNKRGRESSHVIYYVKFHDSQIIGIVAYGAEHNPFPRIQDATIQAVMRAKLENFRNFNI